MKIISLLLLSIFLFISCTTNKYKKNMSSKSISKKPLWLTNVNKVCIEDEELCAIGEGKTLSQSKAKARVELSKIFKTRIKQKQVIEKSLRQQNMDGILTGSVREKMNVEIKEIVDDALKGTKIKETYFLSDDRIYSLASLNRWSASKSMKNEMMKIDDEMKNILENESATATEKLLKLFYKREELNEKYYTLRNKRFSEKYSLSNILKKRNEIKQRNITIFYNFSNKNFLNMLGPLLNKLFKEAGYRVINTLGENANYLLNGEMKHQKLFFNVKGFDKYEFKVLLSVKKISGQVIDTIKFSNIEVGRTIEQAFEKSLNKLEKKLKERFNKLNLQ